MILRIYTDGACSGNQNSQNIGGWGAILEYGKTQKEIFGGTSNTTNNQMELSAVIEALKSLTRTGLQIHIFTDSSYVANCFRQKWYVGWQKRGWLNSQKKPVENRKLWEDLLTLVGEHKVEFFRVKGHVNIDTALETTLQKLYKQFCDNNGRSFTYEDFLYITKMNNRADELANKGMEPFR